jgi:ribonuclease HI
MYDSPRRLPGLSVVGVHARQTPVEAHQGTFWDFQRRHEREASEIAGGTASSKEEFAACLDRRIADSRNVRCAIEHVASDPVKAPGPNQIRVDRLEDYERWNLARTLGDIIREDKYRPGPVRVVHIPKLSGGTRPIEIQNVEDRIVHRAIAQILGPYLDLQFSEHSFGFRPGFRREHALGLATHLIQPDKTTVISEDIRNAFPSVPRKRLINCLKFMGIPDELCNLIERAINRPGKRGISQGSPLSPLLLNVYLNHLLDDPWMRRHPETPIVRFADNLFLVPTDKQAAAELHAELYDLLLPTGMVLKHGADNSICRLGSGQNANWLGYQITWNDGLEIGIGPDGWTRLGELLPECHVHPDAPIRVQEVLAGWVDQMGPTYGSEDQKATLDKIRTMASSQGFEEVPDKDELETIWRGAFIRYRVLRRVIGSTIATFADGSAHQHRNLAITGRGLGEPAVGFPRPAFSEPEVQLFTDGACLGDHGPGGWAYMLIRPEGGVREIDADGVPRATSNQMELTAVIRGLKAIGQPSRVTLFTDSAYVHDGITRHLADWRLRRWRRLGGGRLSNAYLWQHLVGLLEKHVVHCHWIRGHSGHPENEICDHEASRAAHRFAGPTGAWPSQSAVQ